MRILAFIGSVCALSVSLGGEARAIQDINSCNATCTENCRLPTDLSCCTNTNLPQCKGLGPITLPSGYDLDLNGHSITCFCGTKTCNGGGNNNALCTLDSQCPGGTCTNQTGCTSCGTAVTMTANSSIVKNNLNNTVAKIVGAYSTAVDCQSKTGSRVTGIQIQGATARGTYNCAQVDGNVFPNNSGSGVAIDSSGVASSDSIHDNYVDNWYDEIYTHDGFSGSIDHNLLVARDGTTRFAIIDLSSGATIESNVFHGDPITEPPDCGTLFCFEEGFIIGGQAWANNYCDPENSGCAVCIDGGMCTHASSPFSIQ